MFLMPCPHFSLPSHCRCMALGCHCQKCQRGARKSCPCPGGSRVCRSSSSRGSSGHFMPPGAPTIPCLSLCRDRWMEEPQAHWEPPLLEVPEWGVEPLGRRWAARTKDYAAACPAPGWGEFCLHPPGSAHPRLRGLNSSSTAAASGRLLQPVLFCFCSSLWMSLTQVQLRVICFCPWFVLGPTHGRLHLVLVLASSMF